MLKAEQLECIMPILPNMRLIGEESLFPKFVLTEEVNFDVSKEFS
jgi:hypothetical protein